MIQILNVTVGEPLSCTYLAQDQFGHQAPLVVETLGAEATAPPVAPLSSLGSGIITFDLPSTAQAPLTIGNGTPQIETRAHEDGYVGPFVLNGYASQADSCSTPPAGGGYDGIGFDPASVDPGTDVFVVTPPAAGAVTTTCEFSVSDMNGNTVTYPIRLLVPGTTPAAARRPASAYKTR